MNVYRTEQDRTGQGRTERDRTERNCTEYCIELQNESDTLKLGQLLFTCLSKPLLVESDRNAPSVLFFYGDLGMGKTTLSRGILNGAGYLGHVKSPTYTLVEPYELSCVNIYHFDLYRLGEPEELEFMGIRDYFDPTPFGEKKNICLLEWPEKGEGMLPTADIELRLTLKGLGRLAKIKINNVHYTAEFSALSKLFTSDDSGI